MLLALITNNFFELTFKYVFSIVNLFEEGMGGRMQAYANP